MEAIRIFSEIIKDPGTYAEQWKLRHTGGIAGYFCSYTPDEILTAAEALPFRIFGGNARVAKADAHLQAYSCSLVRAGLEAALTGKLDFLDGTVFPHTCDSIQRLSDIWRMNVPNKFHIDVVLPVPLKTESARVYMNDVIRKFRDDLQTALKVEITPEKLKKAVQIHNRVRKCLSRLYEIRTAHPEAISGSDIHTAFKASMIMDREDFAQLLETSLAAFSAPKNKNIRRKRIVLTGGLCNMPDIYPIIEASGGTVVWDDFCTGARYFEGGIEESNDALAAIAERYRSRVVCPAKHAGIHHRGEYLLEKVKTLRADGVIFVFLKFCDPHAFDYPYMQKMLEKEGIPSLLFEIEDYIAGEGQLRTRCEALMEML